MHRRLLFGSGEDDAVQFIDICVTLPDEVTNGMLIGEDIIPQALDGLKHDHAFLL